MRRSVPLPESSAPRIWRLRLWAVSVGLMTATVSALRSSVKAAVTSSGNVSLPAFMMGSSPPGGYLGLGWGELPETSTGMVPKWSR